MSRAAELARQQAVLLALQRGGPAGHAARLQTDAAGLRTYQVNAKATAKRVVLAHYPTVAAMTGEDALGVLAMLLWQQHPPAGGDLGQWGAHLPELLACRAELLAWPWLADCARLDWARHLCERAADAELDQASLHRLGDSDPDELRLTLQPCVQVLLSPWPVQALWEAHQLPAAQQAVAAKEALHQSTGTTATVIWRSHWQTQMCQVSAAVGRWMQALLVHEHPGQPPPSLASWLDRAPEGLDFSAWLTNSVMQGWLWRVQPCAD
jgi:hypothetical protein